MLDKNKLGVVCMVCMICMICMICVHWLLTVEVM